MFMKVVSLFLLCLMINLTGSNLALAGDLGEQTITKREAKIKKRAAKIKEGVRKLGIGKDSVVKVKLRDKTKVKGYISAISDSSFTVVDATGTSHVVEFTKAKQLKGKNSTNGAWIAIGAGLAAMAVFGVVLLVLISKNN